MEARGSALSSAGAAMIMNRCSPRLASFLDSCLMSNRCLGRLTHAHAWTVHTDNVECNRTSKMPQTLTLDHVSPATRLLEKRRQMFEVQEALDAQKEEFARREVCVERERYTEGKEAGLGARCVRFSLAIGCDAGRVPSPRRRAAQEGPGASGVPDQVQQVSPGTRPLFTRFVLDLEVGHPAHSRLALHTNNKQENESKRNRAVKRANDEIKQRLTKEQEVAKLKDHLEQLIHESESLADEVKKNMKYTRYLEGVQETVPEDYPEVADLVNRYRTLKETNRDLRQNQELHEEENEIKRLEFTSFQKERANEILNINNRIAARQRELEVGELSTLRLQHEADASMRMTTQKTLALGQIVMAIGNLLQRCTSGIHGQILKHMEGSNNAAAQSSGDSGASESHTGALSSASSSIAEADVLQHGRKAMGDLEVVAAYMVDFTAIVQGRIDAQRAQKRSSNQVAVPASTNGASAASATQPEASKS